MTLSTSAHGRLIATTSNNSKQSSSSSCSPVPKFKSLALIFATQTYIMLPNLNQYLFFSSSKAAQVASATTTTTTTKSGYTSVVLDRRWQPDEEDEEDNESEIERESETTTTATSTSTTSDSTTIESELNRNHKVAEEKDINHNTFNAHDLNNNDEHDVKQQREQERLERFRKLGAQLRAISDEFARSRR